MAISSVAVAWTVKVTKVVAVTDLFEVSADHNSTERLTDLVSDAVAVAVAVGVVVTVVVACVSRQVQIWPTIELA